MKFLLLILLCICLITLTLCEDVCVNNTFGRLCQFYCHCNVPCNTTTGNCSGSCITPWNGPTCQMYNLAFNKSTDQDDHRNETLDPSSNAVDGDRNGEFTRNGTCIHTKAENSYTTAWWKVDLGDIYAIKSVRIYDRVDGWNKQRMSGYRIHVSNNTNDSTFGSLCYRRTTPLPTLTSQRVYDQNCTITGKYLTISLPYRYNAILDFCEIEVYRCTNGTYGDSCEHQCGYCLNNEICNQTVGVCPNECQPGWGGDTCKQECFSGTYGVNCGHTCGHCKNGERCDKITGACENGCDPGYRTQLCNQQCESGWYGNNCANQCGHCLNGTDCDIVTGYCADGCEPAYQSRYCNRSCTSGTYGDNCEHQCGHCLNNDVCNRIDGICPNSCQPGWSGDTCQRECEDGTYGLNCQHKCGHCMNGDMCNKITGVCKNGCDPGYRTQLCDQKCASGWYGRQCDNQCGQCINRTKCDIISGYCVEGCEPGYQSIYCNKKFEAKPRTGGSEETATYISVPVIILIFFVVILAVLLIIFIVLYARLRYNMRNRYHFKKDTTKAENIYTTSVEKIPDESITTEDLELKVLELEKTNKLLLLKKSDILKNKIQTLEKDICDLESNEGDKAEADAYQNEMVKTETKQYEDLNEMKMQKGFTYTRFQ